MIGVEPSIELEQGDDFVRVNMSYPQDLIIELARRAEENICEEVLARMGYVKVVRCRECRRHHQTYADGAGICNRHGYYTAPKDYCAWGVRKEDE